MTLTIYDSTMTSDQTAHTARLTQGSQHLRRCRLARMHRTSAGPPGPLVPGQVPFIAPTGVAMGAGGWP
jgi:hypothetical protein